MSRIAFRECGFLEDAGDAPSLDPLVGWFWPFPLADGTDATSAALTAADFFQLTWNIRRLRVTGTWNVIGSGLADWTCDFTIDGAASEQALIGGGPLFSGSDSHDDSPGGFNGSCLINIYPIGGKRDGADFYPIVGAQIGSSVIESNTVAGAHSGVTCTLLGKTITLHTVDGADDTTTGSLVIAPDAYWEYRDADGANPVFNAATGAQLITPAPLGL